MPKKIKIYIRKRKKLGDRIERFLKANPSKRNIEEVLCEIMKKDPAFDWVADYGYNYGTVFRAISDCSNGSDVIYKKAYNRHGDLIQEELRKND